MAAFTSIAPGSRAWVPARAARTARRRTVALVSGRKEVPAELGLFVMSGSPAVVEAVSAAKLDWVCIDAQHGAISYERTGEMLRATASNTTAIVRVGGPNDRFGIQQALDLGADGVVVPLINTREEALQAVSYCLYPPAGVRSVAYPVRASLKQGASGQDLATYLASANKKVEVWLQIESKDSYNNIESILSIPGITCAFLGPNDLGMSFGWHVKYNYDMNEMLNSPELQDVYNKVQKACAFFGVASGLACAPSRVAEFAAMGYRYIGYGADLGILASSTLSTVTEMKAAIKQPHAVL